ncbi:MmgE/PrpD family protein [Luedemannella helvata]|uniref:MmgE/PrpD family protein n=1 Tax=Luedemannella helvata TaxID=349315 RepID=A0ABP4X4Z1_9ACTN
MIASQFATVALRLHTEGVGAEARAAASAALAACRPTERTAGGAATAAVTTADATVDAAIRAAAFGDTAAGDDTAGDAVAAADPLTRALRHAARSPSAAPWPWRLVAAALAGQPAQGDRAVDAALIGAEIAHRLAVALRGPVAAAWDAPGRVGAIGAAVTAGLAGGADTGQLASAVAISASLTCGHRVHAGTPLGGLHAGFAAAAGVLAATLGRQGVTGSPTALEGPRGLLNAYGERDAAAGLLDGFGTVWYVLDAPPTPPVPDSGQAPANPTGPDGAADLADQFARFASALSLADLPEAARHAGRRTLANVVGLAVDAARHPAVELVAATLRELGLHGNARALGRPERVSPYAAALLMGYAMHVEDFDDTHLRTVLHPGAPVVAAALAAAQVARASGAEVLAGVVAGVEVGSRLGIALGPGHFDRGWHVTGTVGHVAAAAAAARVLRLTAAQTAQALAIAGDLASGVTEQLGSMTKALHVGRSAADGLQAALLARAGLTGAPDPFGAAGGLRWALSPGYDPDAAVAGLGSAWEIEDNAFKPYSCGIVSHPVIDAAIAVRAAGLTAADIDRVVATVRPVVLEVMGVAAPRDGLQSKFSVYHCFAVGLLDGGAGPAQYSDARATDPAVVELRRRVEARTDPQMPKDACRVEVLDRAGGRHEFVIEHATGSVAAPMTDAQLADKFRLLAAPVLGGRAEQLWRAAMTLDAAERVDDLFTLAGPAERVDGLFTLAGPA